MFQSTNQKKSQTTQFYDRTGWFDGAFFPPPKAALSGALAQLHPQRRVVARSGQGMDPTILAMFKLHGVYSSKGGWE